MTHLGRTCAPVGILACAFLVVGNAIQAQEQTSAHEHMEHDHSSMEHESGSHSGQIEGEQDVRRPGSASAAGPSQNEASEHGVQTASKFIPPVTDEDEVEAFPDLSLSPMKAHMDDDAIQYFALADRFEWQDGSKENQFLWDATGWVGRDFNRLWLRTEGERASGRTEQARIEALWGKPVSRWWNLLAGIRTDTAPGPSQSWLALGVVGLSPYKFEVEATAYVGDDSETAAQLEVEYELLITNRLILQPHLELNFNGQNDERRGIGSGLSNVESGLRLRYEIRREFAPYLGVEWGGKFGKNADFARAEGAPDEDWRVVFGVRAWY